MNLHVVAGLAIGAVALMSSTSFAQDASAPPNSWTQFYAGFGITRDFVQAIPDGGVTLILDGVRRPAPPVIQADKFDVLAGYMHQFDHIVVGAEADLDLGGATRVDPGVAVDDPAIGPCFQSGTNCAIGGITGSLKTLGHARVLLGAPILPNLLLFGTTGIALGEAEVDGVYYETNTGSGRAVSAGPQSGMLVGWTVGAGAQLALTDHISLRGEIYHDFYGTLASGPIATGVTSPSQTIFVFVNKGVDFENTAARATLIVGF